jgi:hypothetical protein
MLHCVAVCRQTDSFSTEYQERYQPNGFDVLQAKKLVKPASRQVHSSKKKSQKKSRKVIDAELLPSESDLADKENSQCSNSLPGRTKHASSNTSLYYPPLLLTLVFSFLFFSSR